MRRSVAGPVGRANSPRGCVDAARRRPPTAAGARRCCWPPPRRGCRWRPPRTRPRATDVRATVWAAPHRPGTPSRSPGRRSPRPTAPRSSAGPATSRRPTSSPRPAWSTTSWTSPGGRTRGAGAAAGRRCRGRPGRRERRRTAALLHPHPRHPEDEDEWWPCELDCHPETMDEHPGLRWHCRGSYVLVPRPNSPVRTSPFTGYAAPSTPAGPADPPRNPHGRLRPPRGCRAGPRELGLAAGPLTS